MMRGYLVAAAFLGLVAGLCASVRAASPLAALSVGSSVKYHVTSQSDTPDGGPQNASHFVKFSRTTSTTIAVTIDGAPAGSIAVSPDGSVNVPDSLKKVLSLFGQIALYMRGAPRPLSPNAGWAATLPVPIKGQTLDVPVVLTVTQLGESGATIVGKGSASTDVQPALRSFPANVSVSTTLRFTPAHTLASATSTVTIDVKMGRLGARQRNYGSSWTIVPAQ